MLGFNLSYDHIGVRNVFQLRSAVGQGCVMAMLVGLVVFPLVRVVVLWDFEQRRGI